MTEKTISFDEALDNNEFFNFEKDQRVIIGIRDWKIVKKEVADYNDKSKKVIKPEFQCTVIAVAKPGDTQAEQIEKNLNSLSVRFMKAIRQFVENKSGVVFISVKRLGDESSTTYDIEPAQSLPLK